MFLIFYNVALDFQNIVGQPFSTTFLLYSQNKTEQYRLSNEGPRAICHICE